MARCRYHHLHLVDSQIYTLAFGHLDFVRLRHTVDRIFHYYLRPNSRIKSRAQHTEIGYCPIWSKRLAQSSMQKGYFPMQHIHISDSQHFAV